MCYKLSCWVLRPEVVLLLTNNVQYKFGLWVYFSYEINYWLNHGQLATI